jgi:uncharacterized membrane protein YdjX (TVP38/TMEM64 family)
MKHSAELVARPKWSGPTQKIAALAVVSTFVMIAWRGGLFDALSDVSRVRALLLGSGGWGGLLYVLGFGLLQPLGVPGIVFLIPASMVWPRPMAFALSLIASLLASSVGFGFARFLARDWVSRHLPLRFRRFDDLLARHGLRAVIAIRLVFFLTPPAHWVIGLSGVRYRTFLLGSALGLIPGIAAVVFLGSSAAKWLLEQPRWVWLLAVVGIVAVLLGRRLFQHQRANVPESPTAPPTASARQL